VAIVRSFENRPRPTGRSVSIEIDATPPLLNARRDPKQPLGCAFARNGRVRIVNRFSTSSDAPSKR